MTTSKGPGLATDRTLAAVVDKLSTGYKTIGQMVYAVLRESILEGTFAPGEWLRQESLATAIGVSRIPVRTALLQLESEGLVTFHPHRGARVRTLVPEQIDEIYRLRALLESYALHRSIPKLSIERIDSLKAIATQLDNDVTGSEFLDLRVSFYRKLYDAENNPMLVQLIEELRSNVGRYLLSLRFSYPDDGHRHGALVEHAARGDVAAAEASLLTHLEQVHQGLLRVLNEETEARDAAQADAPASGQFPIRADDSV